MRFVRNYFYLALGIGASRKGVMVDASLGEEKMRSSTQVRYYRHLRGGSNRKKLIV
jgi:hypothetical protein